MKLMKLALKVKLVLRQGQGSDWLAAVEDEIRDCRH
jgi:hypothetical protein